VTLPSVQAQLARTTVRASGSIAEQKSTTGRSAAIDLAVHSGRIQDLLLLFVSSPRAPLNGTVSLKARAQVPPGDNPFLRKLNLNGDFGIDSAQFTAEGTQQNLDKLSAQARGEKPQVMEDPERVVSDLQGHVNVVNGVANFSELSFHVPGAKAKLHGTFDLVSHRVNLHGTLYMESTLPKATSGVKSFLLKAIDPFLKKNRRGGAEFPVSITGTYESPRYGSDPV
jgi:hypothetical protein